MYSSLRVVHQLGTNYATLPITTCWIRTT